MKIKGSLICITGIDGVGKTTLAKNLIKMMEDDVRFEYVYGRLKPFILRPFIILGQKLFLKGKNIFSDYTNYKNTKKCLSKNYPILAWIYQALLLFDYFIQMLLKIKIRLLFGKNIICDRYIYDVVITDLSIDFNYSEKDVIKVLHYMLLLLPEPDIVFLIDLPEEIAYRRKNDIPSIDYLRDRRRTYLSLTKEFEMVILNGSQSLEELRQTAKEVIRRRYFG
jgi:dTMP kinase